MRQHLRFPNNLAFPKNALAVVCKHPEKYDINTRFKKVQNLIKKVLVAFRVKVEEIDVDKFEASLKENEPRFIVANHISDFDPLIFIALAKRPITVVAKKQILSYPFVARIIKSLSGEFLDRDDLKQSLKVFKSIAKKIEENPSKPRSLLTVKGLGYKLITEE